MKQIILLFILSVLLFNGCSDSDNPAKSNEETLEQQALTFSLKVVNCYFTQDTTSFRNYLPEILYLIDPNRPPYKTSLFILSNYLSSYDYKNYTLENYKEVYDFKILKYQEYINNSDAWLDALKYWYPNNEDYLFVGYKVKEEEKGFMNYKPLLFFVTKKTGIWKIKAIW